MGLAELFFANSSDVYEQTNQQLLQAYQADHHPNGEIIFLAAKPNSRIKGIGTFLLDELTRREKAKKFISLRIVSVRINFTNIAVLNVLLLKKLPYRLTNVRFL
ncbi:GNAT family N-acetyltransferase [Aerococcus suis]